MKVKAIILRQSKQIDNNTYWEILVGDYLLQPTFEDLTEAVLIANAIKQIESPIWICPIDRPNAEMTLADYHFLGELH